MDRQGCDHSSWPDIWSPDLVAIHYRIDHQHDLDLGVKPETVAHIGGIQHTLDLVELHGVGPASDINTVWTKHNSFYPKHVAQKLVKP